MFEHIPPMRIMSWAKIFLGESPDIWGLKGLGFAEEYMAAVADGSICDDMMVEGLWYVGNEREFMRNYLYSGAAIYE